MKDYFNTRPQQKYMMAKLSREPRPGTVVFTCDDSSMVVRDDGGENLTGDCSPNGWIDHADGYFYFEPCIRYAEAKRWTATYEEV